MPEPTHSMHALPPGAIALPLASLRQVASPAQAVGTAGRRPVAVHVTNESVPTAEAYGQDNNGSYVGLNTAAILAIDPASKATVAGAAPTASNFCIQSTVGAHTYNFTRSANVVASGACA